MRLAACDQGNAKFAASLELSFGLFAGANLRRAGAAAARQRRQRLKRGAGSAEMIEQRAKGAWADILAADEPQRVEPLLTAFVLPNKLVKSVGCRKVLIRPCCVVLPFVLVIFRAFPKSDGNYMRHVGDMKASLIHRRSSCLG